MLSPDDLQHRLNAVAHRPIERPDFKRAAVLVPVYWKGEEPHIVFTKRSSKVPTHKGQISFPGGGLKDGETLLEAALRETHEEIGIPPEEASLLGRLDDIITVTNFVVTPYVARIPAEYEYIVSEFEIDEIFDVPLRDLADESKMTVEEVSFEKRSYPIYYFYHQDYIIWGATGKILRHFLAITDVMPGDVPHDSEIPAEGPMSGRKRSQESA